MMYIEGGGYYKATERNINSVTKSNLYSAYNWFGRIGTANGVIKCIQQQQQNS